MNTSDVIRLASQYLANLAEHKFDVLDVSKPVTVNSAVNLAKVISKLSPLLGNLIEFNTVEFLVVMQRNGSEWLKPLSVKRLKSEIPLACITTLNASGDRPSSRVGYVLHCYGQSVNEESPYLQGVSTVS